MARKKRVYVRDPNGTTASPTTVCMCENGKFHIRPITPQTGGAKPISTIERQGRKVITPGELSQIITSNPKAMQPNPNTPGIIMGETDNGNAVIGRLESHGLLGRSQHATFEFRNTSDSEQTVYLGDPANLAALKEGASALSGAVTVKGPYGTTSLAVFKTLVGQMAMDMHQLKFIALDLTIATPSSNDTPAAISSETGSETLASTDLVYDIIVDPLIKNINSVPLNTFDGIKNNTTNPGIREFPEYRKQFNPVSCIKVVLPSAKGIQMQMQLQAYAAIYAMRRY